MNAAQKATARSEIRAVLDRFAVLARDDPCWDEIAKCYATDGIFRLPNGKEVAPTQIKEVLQGGGANYIRHHATSSDVKFISSTEAKVETLFIAITDTAWPDHWGSWKDTFKVQPDGAWKIQYRSAAVENGAPEGWYMQNYGKVHKSPKHGDPAYSV